MWRNFLAKIGTTEIRNILAVIIVLGAFGALYIMLFQPIPAQNQATVNIAVGFVLGGLVGGVSGYYFGASKKDNETNNDKPPA